jgi:SAM-dependent methyltransferase
MFDSLETLALAWEQAGGHGDQNARIERNARWIPYYCFLATGREEATAAINPHAAEVAQALFDRGLISPGSTVLDIGSGTGGFTHAFASLGCRVTALEMDKGSLSVCQAQAEQLGLSTILYENEMWETYAPEKRFDFVFTAMCPAVCNYIELLRMQSYALNGCGIVAVTRGSYDLHRKRLMDLLQVRPQGGMTTEALWYYEALYLSGKQPEVMPYSRLFAYEIPLEEAIERNERYFEIFGIPARDSRPILTEYFLPIAKDGMVQDETLLNTALITWRV